MEEVTILFIYTPWITSHKWAVGDDGLVEYQGNRVSPQFVYENFIKDYPMFEIVRAEVCTRIIGNDELRPYTWRLIKRFDK